MTQIVTPSQIQQPRIVTREELRKKLLPICLGWAWAENAIDDLWKLGAPIPQGPNQPERRILLPGQFRKWFGELQQRMGYAQTGHEAYNELSRRFRTSGGMT